MVEALIAVVIVGILAAIAVPSWASFIRNQKMSAAVGRIQSEIDSKRSKAKELKISQVVQRKPISEIDSNIKISYPSDNLNFDFGGGVEKKTNSLGNYTYNLPYVINLSYKNTSIRRCVVVVTILGNVRVGKDADECSRLAAI